jgi:hypothetical protein
MEKDHKEFAQNLKNIKDTKGGFSVEYNLEPYRKETLRYIILFYDKNSPLWQSIPSFEDRKVTALQMAGFKIDDSGQFPVEVTNGIIYGKNQVVNKMIVRYVFLFNNPQFILLTGLLSMNYNLLNKIQGGDMHKDTLATFRSTSNDIEKLTKQVFGGKENMALEEELYSKLNMHKMLYRPEHIAERIREGKRPTKKDLDSANK